MGWRRAAVMGVAAAIFTLDRVAKALVVANMVPGQTIPVLPPVLSITFVLNAGAAFGLLQHQGPLFIVVAVALLAGVVWYTVRARTLPAIMVVGTGLLAGGAAGNLWDRLVAGRVVDYIHIGPWPVFNFADSGIVVGMLLIVYHFWRSENRRAVETDSSAEDSSSSPSSSGRR